MQVLLLISVKNCKNAEKHLCPNQCCFYSFLRYARQYRRCVQKWLCIQCVYRVRALRTMLSVYTSLNNATKDVVNKLQGVTLDSPQQIHVPFMSSVCVHPYLDIYKSTHTLAVAIIFHVQKLCTFLSFQCKLLRATTTDYYVILYRFLFIVRSALYSFKLLINIISIPHIATKFVYC